MIFDDDPKATYRWEQGINKTWDSVQEDEAGNLITTSDDRQRSYRAKQHRITKSIRRGLIRYLVVAIDSSKFSLENDYKPCRLEVSKACVQKFIGEYYDQNPISQMGVILTRDRSAERLTELSGNPKNHIHMIKAMRSMTGLASLQNTIILGMNMLRHIPNYGHREILVVYSSLSTCDPGDIFTTIKEAKQQKVRISVICMVAEVFICRQVAELTGGTFAVALDATHLSELLQQQTIPPPEVQRNESLVTDFIYMGFPKRAFDSNVAYGFEGKKMKLSANAYICPRCSTRTTDIPTQCCVCNLQLNSSSHIARSYHHLFPVPNYIEYEVRESTLSGAESQQAVTANVDALTLTLKKSSQPGEGKRPVVKVCTAVCIDGSVLNPAAGTVTGHGSNHTTSNDSAANMSGKGDHNGGGGTEGQQVDSAAAVDREVMLTGPLQQCRGCLDALCSDKRMVLRCPQCKSFFCVECDLFVHDSLHNCPGCG